MARRRKKIDMGDLRKDYSRLRSIARKRMERMGKSEFSGTQTYLHYGYFFNSMFPSLENIDALYGDGNYEKIKSLTDKLTKFLGQRRSTVRGLRAIRKESLRTLRANGFEFLNVYNWSDWLDFIMWWKETHPEKSYGSPKPEELKTYLDNISNGMSREEAKRRFMEYEDNKTK